MPAAPLRPLWLEIAAPEPPLPRVVAERRRRPSQPSWAPSSWPPTPRAAALESLDDVHRALGRRSATFAFGGSARWFSTPRACHRADRL